MLDGLNKIFTPRGKPKQLYSDEELPKRSGQMNRFLRDNEINSVQTTTHAHTVEKFIRTFKLNCYRRLDALNEDKTKWITHKDNIIEKYNSTKHNITQIKPNGAGKKENHVWVTWHLQNAAKKNRKHPDIKDCDMVRYELKPSIGTKSRETKWNSTGHKLLEIPGITNITYQA